MTFTLVGLSTPATNSTTELQIILGDEEGYTNFYEWGKTSIEAPQS